MRHSILVSSFVGGSVSNSFNGIFQILSVTTSAPYSFTYSIESDPGADPSGSPRSAPAVFFTLLRSGTTATFFTPLPHTLEAGQGIVVSMADDPSVPNSAFYNGGFKIKSVPTPNTLTYDMAGVPAGAGAASAQLVSHWQVGHVVAEKNIIELGLNLLQIRYAPPTGIELSGQGQKFPYVFGHAGLSGNYIRNIDGAIDPSQNGFGIPLDSCEDGVFERNIMVLNTPWRLFQQNTCGNTNISITRGAIKNFV